MEQSELLNLWAGIWTLTYSYKSVSHKKACTVVLKSSEHEEITFTQKFIFVFALHFNGSIFSKKYGEVCARAGHIRGAGVSIEGGQTFYLLLRWWNQTCRTSANIINLLCLIVRGWRGRIVREMILHSNFIDLGEEVRSFYHSI